MATGLSISLGCQAAVAGHRPLLWPRLHVDSGSGDVCAPGLSRTTWKAGSPVWLAGKEPLLSLLWGMPQWQGEKARLGGGAQQCAELGEAISGPPVAEELAPRGCSDMPLPVATARLGLWGGPGSNGKHLSGPQP